MRPTIGPGHETVNWNQPRKNQPKPAPTRLSVLQKTTFQSYIILITLYAPFLAWI